MSVLNRDGVDIYYEVHGDGPAILLSHGFSSSSRMWKGQIDPLAKNHALIIWDMRGHGHSAYPEDASLYSEAHTIEDMVALLDHVEAEQAIIGGLSLGGYMSLAFNALHPERVRALALFDTGPGYKSDSGREVWNQSAEKIAQGFEKKGLEVLKSSSSERATSRHRSAEGLIHAARGMLTQKDDHVIQTLPGIDVPTLALVGGDDTAFIAPTDYMAGKIKNAQKVVIPKAGHGANIDQPEAFNDAFLSFLKSL